MTPSPKDAATGFGANEWLVDELYQAYLTDKSSVDEAWWDFFADYKPSDGSAVRTHSVVPAVEAAPQAAAAPTPTPTHRPCAARFAWGVLTILALPMAVRPLPSPVCRPCVVGFAWDVFIFGVDVGGAV